MQMIIGGACQGKKSYADRICPGINWIDGETCRIEDIYSCQGIYHFERYVRRMLSEGLEIREFSEQLLERNPDIVIVGCEIGYGLVPVDAFERRYREETGRICTRLAAFSERVDRVVCGIGMTIKGGNADED